jgi:hypothetical protein
MRCRFTVAAGITWTFKSFNYPDLYACGFGKNEKFIKIVTQEHENKAIDD